MIAHRGAEGLEQRPRHRIVGGVPLRMPLHRHGEAGRCLDHDRLRRRVGRIALDDDAPAAVEDALAVQRVHQHLARPEQAVERPAVGEADDMAMLELLLQRAVRRHPVVDPPRDLADLRVQRPAEGDVELLKAAADAEDRHAARHALPDQRQRHRIAVRIEGAVLLGRRVTVEARGVAG